MFMFKIYKAINIIHFHTISIQKCQYKKINSIDFFMKKTYRVLVEVYWQVNSKYFKFFLINQN